MQDKFAADFARHHALGNSPEDRAYIRRMLDPRRLAQVVQVRRRAPVKPVIRPDGKPDWQWVLQQIRAEMRKRGM